MSVGKRGKSQQRLPPERQKSYSQIWMKLAVLHSTDSRRFWERRGGGLFDYSHGLYVLVCSVERLEDAWLRTLETSQEDQTLCLTATQPPQTLKPWLGIQTAVGLTSCLTYKDTSSPSVCVTPTDASLFPDSPLRKNKYLVSLCKSAHLLKPSVVCQS